MTTGGYILTGGLTDVAGSMTIAPIVPAISVMDFLLETEWTTGTILNADFSSSTTLTGSVIGAGFDFQTNVVATGYSATGLSVSLPTVTNTGDGIYYYQGLVVLGGNIVQTTLGGTNNWIGAAITMPAITQTTGTVSAFGLAITGGVVNSGSASGVYVAMNVGTDTAINVAQGNSIFSGLIYPNADVVFDNAVKGVILKDTQGSPHYWRVTIDNSGVLVTSDLGTTKPVS